MKPTAPTAHLLVLAAATLTLGVTVSSVRAQTVYSTGATGANGAPGTPGTTVNISPTQTYGTNGGVGGAGTPALDLSGSNAITAGTYQGGAGGQGGNGGTGTFASGQGGAGGAGGSAVVAESGSTVTITGGRFHFGLGGAAGSGAGFSFTPPTSGANGYTLLDNGGAITLFGTFTGGPQTFAAGTGSFTGTLTNEAAAQTFTYDITAGSITLAASPAPEPGTWALLALGTTALALAARHRHVRRA